MKYTFRFDDVSLNTDPVKLDKMVAYLRDLIIPRDLQIMFVVSPAVHDVAGTDLEKERTFPSIMHTESDFRVFYMTSKIGIPEVVQRYRSQVQIAAHGMMHVDHRLLHKSAQELSLLMSCSLLNTTLVVMPFNKYNSDTESICTEHKLHLIKYSAAWKHLAYHRFDPRHEAYYLHTHDFTLEQFTEKFKPA